MTADRMISFRALGALVFVLLLTTAACTDQAKIRPHATLSSDAEPLRAQFNRDVGRVRVLMVVAPT